MRTSLRLILAASLLLVATARSDAQAQDQRRGPSLPFIPFGAVYALSNAADGNAVLAFDRSLDGRLRPSTTVPTGGQGSGAALGSQGSIVLSENERWLIAVNAGSDDVSVLEVRRRGLRLTSRVPSGGSQPVSVAIHGRLVYVVNAGSGSISGFVLGRRGQLEPLSGSTRSLSDAAAGPAQIAFSPGGDHLVVTEKATNQIVTYPMGRDGLPGDPQVQASSGQTPFGFAFGRRDDLFVSEAFGGAEGQSAVSSYELDDDGTLQTVSASVATGQTAACWVVTTLDGRFAYTTNTGSGSISGYAVDHQGQLTALDRDGRTAVTGDGSLPSDMALSRGGSFLYVLNPGTRSIATFLVGPTGRLTPLGSTSGLPATVFGLAAR